MSSGSSAGNHAADAQTTDTGDGGSNTAVIVGAALGSAVVLILLIAFSCYLWRRRRNAQTVPPPPPHPNMYQAQPYAVQPYAGAQPYAAQSGTVGTVGTSTGRFHAGHMASASFSHSHSHAPSDPWSPRPPSSQSPPQYEYTASMSDLPPVPVTNHRIGGREDAAAALMGNYSSFDLAPPSPSPPPHANAGVTLLTGGPARGDRKVRVGARDPANSPPAY
ncbi:hypothetical protein EXIGLDRAFT_242682 [Exidia glandulosa HHB12029]|uniref:Uncharacterized protein n=1 Tax=Exidia glandulosa HHB12029 TaxID=1314781 RepID=A0A165Q7Y4_EXIGL|nr:hypothetical protein EXIGLDRAFT_242682 [Exidia glandulosa HHB12029]